MLTSSSVADQAALSCEDSNHPLSTQTTAFSRCSHAVKAHCELAMGASV